MELSSKLEMLLIGLIADLAPRKQRHATLGESFSSALGERVFGYGRWASA